MIFDRILEDSLGFIRRMLWARSEKTDTSRPPFQSMHTIEGDNGVISLLEGRDTPRAVRTWMYSPKRRDMNSAQMVASTSSMDLHIYCDFLGPLPTAHTPKAEEERESAKARRQRGEIVPTHRLQIFKASHFLNKDGFYTYELVFWQDYDFFVVNGPKPDQMARATVDYLVKQCLRLGEPLKYKAKDWEPIVEKVRNEVKTAILAKKAS